MAVVLEDIENQYAFSFDSEALGRIRVWPAHSCDALEAFNKHYVYRESPRDFALFFLSRAAAPEDQTKPRHKKELFTREQLNSLTDHELDEIIEAILQHHSYFYEGRYGDPQERIPRHEEESAAEHLRRVVEAYRKRQNDAIRKTLDELTSAIRPKPIEFESLFNQNIALAPVENPQHRTNATLELMHETIRGTAFEINRLRFELAAAADSTSRQVRFATGVAIVALIVAIIIGLAELLK